MRKELRRAKVKLIAWLNRRLAPYEVIAQSYDLKAKVRHYCWSWDDALDWVECYHAADFVVVRWQGLLTFKSPKAVAWRGVPLVYPQ